MVNLLYVSFTGLTEPLGKSQVLNYLEGLSDHNEIWLISMEKVVDQEVHSKIQRHCATYGIHWFPVPYRKYRPRKIAIFQNIISALSMAKRIVKSNRIDLVHARSHPSSVIALYLLNRNGIPYIFDFRGFTADERFDSGQWSRHSVMYNAVSLLHRKSLKHAAGVVVLTKPAERLIRAEFNGSSPPIEVITTCVDLKNFHRKPVSENEGQFVLGYVGSVLGRYRFDDAINCFKYLRQSGIDARFLILNKNDHGSITRLLSRSGISDDNFELISAEHHDMASYLSRMDAAVFPLADSKSSFAASPTKMGELLACGVPCMTNSAVGDAEEILEGNQVGIVLKEDSENARNIAMDRLVELARRPGINGRCRKVAEEYFDLRSGILAYNSIYSLALVENPSRIREGG